MRFILCGRHTYLCVVIVVDFIVGCSVQFAVGKVGKSKNFRKKNGTKTPPLYVHSIWGTKNRIQRFINAKIRHITNIFFLNKYIKMVIIKIIIIFLRYIIPNRLYFIFYNILDI